MSSTSVRSGRTLRLVRPTLRARGRLEVQTRKRRHVVARSRSQLLDLGLQFFFHKDFPLASLYASQVQRRYYFWRKV